MSLKTSTYGWLVAALLLAGCSASRYADRDNLSDLYNKESTTVHPEFYVYNLSDDTSELYFKLNTDELLYTRSNKNSEFTSIVLISYQVYSSLDTKVLVDSATQKVVDINNELATKELIGSIQMSVPTGGDYTIKITTIDLNRKQENQSFIQVNKSSVNSRQNFLLTDTETGKPLFNYYFSANQNITIQCHAGSNQILGRYYSRDFALAAPPHSLSPPPTFSYDADSLFTLVVDTNARVNLTMPAEGFIHLQNDTTDKEGLTLFAFSTGFPSVITYESMLLPLRYVSQKVEYETMEEAPDVKQAIESFWLDISNSSEERASELIKQFYLRVEEANKSFTSYMEGWKTDRGLLYIIYGSPNVLYKNDHSETWVYGEETNIMSITFTFNKVSNPFSDNDFELSRNELYRSSYYRAVDSWRQGRVYSTN